MVRLVKTRAWMVVAVLTAVFVTSAQTQPQREDLAIQGYSGQASLVRFQGRSLVDVQDLARITNGSLSFEENRIILTMSQRDATDRSAENAPERFSRPFMKGAIEAMASIREWGGMLKVIVENGYPVGRAMSGTTIRAYQGRAADSVALAASAASTDSDNRGLELLRNEFNNVQAWSEAFVEARNSLSAANLTTSENGLKNDEEAQKILGCGQFLAQMFASGTFQDDAACH